MQAKQCCACKQTLSADRFGINRAKKSGLSSRCRECARPLERLIAKRQRDRHGEKINARISAYNKANGDRKRAQVRAWEAANADHVRERQRRKNARLRQNPRHRLRQIIAVGIWKTLRGDKGGRSWTQLVDFTPDEIRVHLERQFLKGMGWHNMGEWHIDHIVPLSSFTITGPDDPELRRAWALTNLRPLWAADNLRKGSTIVSLL